MSNETLFKLMFNKLDDKQRAIIISLILEKMKKKSG